MRNPRTPRPGESGAQRFGEFADRLHGDHWQPDVDVFETEDAIVVRAELAGVRRGDLRVTVDGDLLRIRGLREGSGVTGTGLGNGTKGLIAGSTLRPAPVIVGPAAFSERVT